MRHFLCLGGFGVPASSYSIGLSACTGSEHSSALGKARQSLHTINQSPHWRRTRSPRPRACVSGNRLRLDPARTVALHPPKHQLARHASKPSSLASRNWRVAPSSSRSLCRSSCSEAGITAITYVLPSYRTTGVRQPERGLALVVSGNQRRWAVEQPHAASLERSDLVESRLNVVKRWCHVEARQRHVAGAELAACFGRR